MGSALASLSVAGIAGGSYFTIARASTGKVYSFGSNWYGHLGTGDDADRWTPTLMRGAISSLSCTGIAAGYSHVVSLASTGTSGSSRKTAIDPNFTFTPSSCTNFTHQSTTHAPSHISYVTGKIYTTGYNWAGQLGLGDTTDRSFCLLLGCFFAHLFFQNDSDFGKRCYEQQLCLARTSLQLHHDGSIEHREGCSHGI